MRILLIDDDAFMLKLLARQLARLGLLDVTPCDDAAAALALLRADAQAFDVILCDLQMPHMDGVEFVRHLAGVGYTGGLLLVSGEDARIVQTVLRLAQAHRLDVLGAVAKPVDVEALRPLLRARQPRAATPVAAARPAYGVDELRRAITEGELVAHYQPKVELASGALAGVEALVRWRHPRAGLVYPDQFVGVAEQHGLIDELTRAVLRAAVAQARAWLDEGLALRVAVNVSMDNLGALEFPDHVAQVLHEAGVPCGQLILEVTESRLMQDPLGPLDVLTRLRLKHVGLSIDDFGTGHSSLVQLRDIPFQELKIDRSFVHGGGADPAMRAIVEASLRLARELGMKTVAEGVEDLADWNFVRGAGCTQAQGYFIARPMAAADLAAWRAAWEARRASLPG